MPNNCANNVPKGMTPKRIKMNSMMFSNPKSVGQIINGEVLIQTQDNTVNIDISADKPYIAPYPCLSKAEQIEFYNQYQKKYITAKKNGISMITLSTPNKSSQTVMEGKTWKPNWTMGSTMTDISCSCISCCTFYAACKGLSGQVCFSCGSCIC